MRDLLDLRNSLADFSVERSAKQAISKTAPVIAQLNVEQLQSGETSQGTNIKPSYASRSYAEMKNTMNPDPGIFTPDLILTGRFVSSFEVDVDSEEFEVLADDPNDLEEKYGEDIYGMQENQQDYYTHEVFFDEFAERFTAITGIEL